MMRITVLAIGKLKEKYFRDACAEYEKRLSAFCKLDIIEIDETKCPSNPSKSDIDNVVRSEGEKIIAKIPKGALVIPLCIEGTQISSEKLSSVISEAALIGESSVAFIIGGSWGLSDSIKALGKLRLSMSSMTFPHMLARVMLLEQIYRSFMISNGGEYHK
jgi:23S rRNA (pseudouridine1915-N3)-methyltransferase